MFGIIRSLFGSKNDRLEQAIKNGALLVDVRSAQEFQSGTAQGAINIPLGELPGKLERHKNKKDVVVFCRSGMRSAQAKSVLERNGYRDIVNGGTWQQVQAAAISAAKPASGK